MVPDSALRARVQVEEFVKNDATQSPLYLVVACEELRLQAEYGLGGEGVDTFVKALPDSTQGLMNMVLARVECVASQRVGGGCGASIGRIERSRWHDSRMPGMT